MEERDKRTSARRSMALDDIGYSEIKSILDIGCGNGVAGFDIPSRTNSATLTGVDLELDILREAKRKSPQNRICNFSAGNGIALPITNSSFDLVTCQYLLQHVNPQLEIPISYPSYRYFVRQNAKLLELWQTKKGRGWISTVYLRTKMGDTQPPTCEHLCQIRRERLSI